MAQRIIGLDLGTRQVKAVVIEGGLRGFTVAGAWEAPVPAASPPPPPPPDGVPPPGDGEAATSEPSAPPPSLADRLSLALEALKGQEIPRAEAVYTAIPGGEVTTHLLTLPFTDARKLEQTLPFELEDQLPFDLDEVVWDYQVLGQRNGQSEVLVAVVRKEIIEGLLATLAAAGLDPRVVSVSALAYQNLFAHGVMDHGGGPEVLGGAEQPAEDAGAPPAAPEATTEAILDIGHVSTDLLVVEAGAARFARSFPIAGRALTVAIASAEGLTFEDAESLKEQEARIPPPTLGPDPDPRRARLAAALARGLAPLVRGIRQSLLAHGARSKAEVRRIHLTGGTARLPGLAAWLERELGVEVVPLDPFRPDAEGKRPEADPVDALALALALRGQPGARTTRMNLRKGPYAFKGDLSYLRGNLTRLAVLGAILLVLAGVNVFARFRVLAAEEARVEEALCQLTEDVLGECFTNPDDAVSRMRGGPGGGGRIPQVSASEVLDEVTKRLRSLESVELSELDIATGKVRLQGEADSFDSVAKVVQALKGWSCFGEVTQGQTRQGRRSERIEFNVDAVLTAECTG